MKKSKWKVMAGLVAALVAGAGVLCLLFYNGVLLLNNPSREDYPVRGVDVSSYQGEIDWEVLAAQDIQFAFIKATEGSSFTDPYFAHNFAAARQTDLRVGAYHFFSYDSAGKTQAENFIAAVPAVDGMLPPVVDVEYYGDYEKTPPDKAAVQTQLNDMLPRLEEHYGCKPILYATEKSYQQFLAGAYTDYDLWIRSIVGEPTLTDKRKWTFWQYTNREKLPGYEGKESFIDMNVFAGSQEQFERYRKAEGQEAE